MTKSELIAELASANPHLLSRDVELIVSTIFEEITAALARGTRVLLAVPPEAADMLEALAADAGVVAARLGPTGGDRLVVPGLLDLSLSRLRDAYEGALSRALGEST